MTPETRGQATLVGVAVLLALTVLSVGVLTVAVGETVERGAASADAGRVAADATALTEPEPTGTVKIRFAAGRVHTVDREVRLLNRTSVVRRVEVGGLVYERGPHRVAVVAGAVVRGHGESAWLHAGPRIRLTDETLLVSVVALGADSDWDIGDGGSEGVELRTRPTHERTALSSEVTRVAVESERPAAWERSLTDAGATTVERRDIDGDGVESVVATFPDREWRFLAVHRLNVEVIPDG